MSASVSKTDMIHITVSDGIFSVLDTRITIHERIKIEKDKYVRKNNVRMLAQPTDMKENLSQYKQEHIRYILSECHIRQSKPPQIKTVSQIQFSGNII